MKDTAAGGIRATQGTFSSFFTSLELRAKYSHFIAVMATGIKAWKVSYLG